MIARSATITIEAFEASLSAVFTAVSSQTISLSSYLWTYSPTCTPYLLLLAAQYDSTQKSHIQCSV
jgi:hypothetical protein